MQSDGRAPRLVLGVLVAVTLGLSACGLTASRGTMPPADPNGDIDPSAVPDYIAYVGRTDRVIGWVPKSYLLDPPEFGPIPVYADDLVTLIGHDFPGRGFVPLGQDPASVPERPVQVGPSHPAPDSP